MEEDFFTVKVSTKYILSLIVVGMFLILPASGLVIWYGVYFLLYNYQKGLKLIIESLITILFGITPIWYIPFLLRYHIGKVFFKCTCVELHSPIAKKIEINWEECISYGATCKLQNIALPSVAWLYFSKKAIDAKKAFKRAPQSGKDIIFVSVKGNMLEEIKNYIPEHIYTKIYSDLIIREYPIAKE